VERLSPNRLPSWSSIVFVRTCSVCARFFSARPLTGGGPFSFFAANFYPIEGGLAGGPTFCPAKLPMSRNRQPQIAQLLSPLGLRTSTLRISTYQRTSTLADDTNDFREICEAKRKGRTNSRVRNVNVLSQNDSPRASSSFASRRSTERESLSEFSCENLVKMFLTYARDAANPNGLQKERTALWFSAANVGCFALITVEMS
jgi:hypothetical protein